MKYLPITLLSLLFIFASCNTNEDNLNTSALEGQENGLKGRAPFGEIKNQEEKNMMYMTSYLIARTLLEDEDAQKQFYKLGSGKSLKIDLRTLLTPDKPFEAAFRLRYARYNGSTPPKGQPTTPVSQAVPDPLERDYSILTISYIDYIDVVNDKYDWIIYLPNKEKLYEHANFGDYLDSNEDIINLWSFDTSDYSDGLKLNYYGGIFIPIPFDYTSALESTFIMTLKNK